MSQNEAKNQQEIITDEAELDEEALDQIAGGAASSPWGIDAPIGGITGVDFTKLDGSKYVASLDIGLRTIAGTMDLAVAPKLPKQIVPETIEQLMARYGLPPIAPIAFAPNGTALPPI